MDQNAGGKNRRGKANDRRFAKGLRANAGNRGCRKDFLGKELTDRARVLV